MKFYRSRPDWWPELVEWWERCEVRGCGRFTAVRVVRAGVQRPRCDRHRHRNDAATNVPGPPSVSYDRANGKAAA